MAKRKKRLEEKERELTRKEVRLRERDRERHRTLYMGVGAALALALILLIAGALYAFAYVPNSTLATVGDETIVTKDFWERMRLEKNRLTNQLLNLQQLEQQFGQSFFTSQINQIQAQLQSPFALGVQVLDQMIDERVVAQAAAERDVTVSEEEVDAALREEIARNRGAVTEPQATETADAATQATATAAEWTPTPTPTIDASLVVTATATTVPTPEPLPTSAILSETGYTEGVNELTDFLGEIDSVNLAGYRQIVRYQLLTDKMTEVIADETVSSTEEQVHARHILISVMTPTVEISGTEAITTPIDGVDSLTETATLSATAEVTTPSPLTATAPVSPTATAATTATTTVATATVTTTAPLSVTAAVSATAAVTTSASLTDTAALTGTDTLTDTPEPRTPVERTDAEAQALAEEIRQRLLAGEDFATLAQEYSDDTGSGAQGGDLDWFGRGAMVAHFEEAAFSLEVGEISEPIKTQFGYHIIEVLEKDENRPKDEAQLQQERSQAFDSWLEEQKQTMTIERPVDLNARIPRDLR
jgi:hypothetical protein